MLLRLCAYFIGGQEYIARTRWWIFFFKVADSTQLLHTLQIKKYNAMWCKVKCCWLCNTNQKQNLRSLGGFISLVLLTSFRSSIITPIPCHLFLIQLKFVFAITNYVSCTLLVFSCWVFQFSGIVLLILIRTSFWFRGRAYTLIWSY